MGGNGGMGGGNIGNNGGFNPYQNLDPRQFFNNNTGNNNVNPVNPVKPYNNNPNFTFGPTNPNNQVIGTGNQNNQQNIPANLGPNIYVPP